jgi:hypothetical protein
MPMCQDFSLSLGFWIEDFYAFSTMLAAFGHPYHNMCRLPIAVTALSKAWVCGGSLAGIAGWNPAGGMSLVSVECCQVEVSATGRSHVLRNLTRCGVSECGSEASINRRLWPTGVV